MTISDHVQVTITPQLLTISRSGFGVPLLLAHHTLPDVVRTYNTLTALQADLGANHPAVKMATSLLSQEPRPTRFKLGRVTNGDVQEFTIDGFPSNTADADVGKVVSLSVLAPDGTTHEIEHTIAASETPADIAVAIGTQVNAISGISGGAVGAVVEAAADVVGTHFHVSRTKNCTFTDTTVDLGYAAAIDAIRNVDDDWYGVAIEHPSDANIEQVSAKIQTLSKVFISHYQGSVAAYVALLGTLEAASRDRTALLYSTMQRAAEYSGAAWMGRVLPLDPGGHTWKFKTLKNITVDPLTESDVASIKAANGNVYISDAGIAMTQEGVMATGRFIDVVRSIDWLTARIKENELSLLAQNDGIDYDDAGVEQVVGVLDATLKRAVDQRVLRAGTIQITYPKVADIAPEDREGRILPDVAFGAEYRGSVHKVIITGNLAF